MIKRTALLLLAVAVPAAAQDIHPHPQFAAPYVQQRLAQGYASELNALRAEGLRLQAADGGTLTAEHRARIEAKLNHINELYRWQVTDAEQYNVDTKGQSIRPRPR